jgi:response regulator of citrate/malate metabolism
MLRKSLRITKEEVGCRTEFNYLWVWHTAYECVDANFLYLGNSRAYSLEQIKEYVYKLWYMNPDATIYDISEEVIRIVHSKLHEGVFVLESDVYDLINEIFSSDIPNDISDIVKKKRVKNGFKYTTKKIEWKSDVNGLLILNEVQRKEYELSENKEEKLKELYKSIKLKYAMKCINKVNKSCNEEIVGTAIDVIREYSKDISIFQISRESGLSLPTVRKYIDLIADRLDCVEGYKVIRNAKKEIKDNKMIQLIEACKKLKSENRKVNKINLNKETEISRITINNYWNELNDYFNKLSI